MGGGYLWDGWGGGRGGKDGRCIFPGRKQHGGSGTQQADSCWHRKGEAIAARENLKLFHFFLPEKSFTHIGRIF